MITNFLTIQILTHNCQEHISRCLKSLKPIFPFIKDIVIIDDDSNDKTFDKIKKFHKEFPFIKIKLIKHKKGEGGFSEQRNLAISKSDGSWILILDSDETFDKTMYWELHKMCFNYNNIIAWFFPRILLFPDVKHFLVDGYPDFQMRLFKKIDGIQFTRKVHEYLIYKKDDKKQSLGINQPGTSITTAVHFFHYQLLTSERKLEEKGKRWSKLAQDSKQSGFDIVGKDAYKFKTYQNRIGTVEALLNG